jgi:hypothetical protein
MRKGGSGIAKSGVDLAVPFINLLHVGFHPAFVGFYHVILCILEVPLAL